MSEVVQFLTGQNCGKTAMVLPVTDYEKLREAGDDLSVNAERRGGQTIPHAEFRRHLKRQTC